MQCACDYASFTRLGDRAARRRDGSVQEGSRGQHIIGNRCPSAPIVAPMVLRPKACGRQLAKGRHRCWFARQRRGSGFAVSVLARRYGSIMIVSGGGVVRVRHRMRFAAEFNQVVTASCGSFIAGGSIEGRNEDAAQPSTGSRASMTQRSEHHSVVRRGSVRAKKLPKRTNGRCCLWQSMDCKTRCVNGVGARVRGRGRGVGSAEEHRDALRELHPGRNSPPSPFRRVPFSAPLPCTAPTAVTMAEPLRPPTRLVL